MLQTIFIKKMKLQTSWLILEHFCYNEKLRISEEYLVDTKTRLREENEQWEGIELSDIAKEYLTKLYDKYENSKGYLNHDDLEDIFQTTIEGIPWEIEEITNISKNYHIDLKTWIGLWQKAFSEDYASAYELIVYLGFCEPFDSTVDIKIERQDALLSQSGKTVFNCFIIGKN